MSNLLNNFIGYIKINTSKILWIILFAMVLCVVFELLQRCGLLTFKQSGWKRIVSQGLLGTVCSVIYVLTLFDRRQMEYGVSFIPFESYMMAFRSENSELILENLMNIIVYVPVGFLLPYCFKYFEKWRRTLAIVLNCSIAIELIQGFVAIGYMEVDDVLNNVIGALLGEVVYWFMTRKTQEKIKRI